MKADDIPPDVPPAALNPEKDPDEWVTKDEPMTGPQRSYLQTLCREAGEEFDQNWTKAEASKKIEELQQKTGRGKSGSQPLRTPSEHGMRSLSCCAGEIRPNKDRYIAPGRFDRRAGLRHPIPTIRDLQSAVENLKSQLSLFP